MKVSVIMPVYNASAALPRSLESLRRQSFRDFEAVFVDDGSTDNTEALVQSWIAEGNRFPIRYYKFYRHCFVLSFL